MSRPWRWRLKGKASGMMGRQMIWEVRAVVEGTNVEETALRTRHRLRLRLEDYASKARLS